ncbi:MAG TPA: transposase [Pseudonocardiaceae bacterium]|nr:transposase [Pseudonocardiaceae bacterium]
MSGQRRYPPELRERAVQMYRSAQTKPVIRQMARQLGVHPEALRTWIRADEGRPVDKHPARSRGRARGAAVPVEGVLSADAQEELDALRLEVMELRRANEILRAASAYFAATLDRTGRPSFSSSASYGTRSGSSRYSGN